MITLVKSLVFNVSQNFVLVTLCKGPAQKLVMPRREAGSSACAASGCSLGEPLWSLGWAHRAIVCGASLCPDLPKNELT